MNIWYGTNELKHLSNLYHRRFSDKEGRAYVSVEHAYQTWKAGAFDAVTYHKPWRCGAKFIGRDAKRGWNIDLMYRLIYRSFEENPVARDALLATGDAVLTHTQDRGIWRTKFPELLMKVRAELSTS